MLKPESSQSEEESVNVLYAKSRKRSSLSQKTKNYSESKARKQPHEGPNYLGSGAKSKMKGKENDIRGANAQVNQENKNPFSELVLKKSEASGSKFRPESEQPSFSQQQPVCDENTEAKFLRHLLHDTQERFIDSLNKVNALKFQQELEAGMTRHFLSKLQENYDKENASLREENNKKSAVIKELQIFIKNYVELTYMTSFSLHNAYVNHQSRPKIGGLNQMTPRGNPVIQLTQNNNPRSVAEDLGSSAKKMEKKLLALERMWLNQEKKSLKDINEGSLKKSILLDIKAKELELKCSCEILNSHGTLEENVTQKILALDCESLFQM